jgi:hypothetical protein
MGAEFRGTDCKAWKNFPIREPFKLQFRAEAYNVFNHTQFSSVNTTAQFNPAGASPELVAMPEEAGGEDAGDGS